MKKRIIMLVMAVAVAAVFAGCGAPQAGSSAPAEEESKTKDIPVVEQSEAPMEEEPSEAAEASANAVILNGQELSVGMEATEDFMAGLGEAINKQNAPSCHFDGEDTIYTYENATLYTYKDGDSTTIYIVELTADGIETDKGAKVGMTKDEVVGIHGEGYEESPTAITYSGDGVDLTFFLDEEGKVSFIEYLKL